MNPVEPIPPVKFTLCGLETPSSDMQRASGKHRLPFKLFVLF